MPEWACGGLFAPLAQFTFPATTILLAPNHDRWRSTRFCPYDNDDYDGGHRNCQNVCAAEELTQGVRNACGNANGYRHVDVDNFPFVDGHVKAVKLEQTFDPNENGMSMWTVSNVWCTPWRARRATAAHLGGQRRTAACLSVCRQS